MTFLLSKRQGRKIGKIFVILTFLLLYPAHATATKDSYRHASLVRLSVGPDIYEGERLVISGYFVASKEPGEYRLYLTKDSYLSSSMDFVYIEPEDKFIAQDAIKIGRGYVYVHGTFTSWKNLSDGNCIGALRHVSGITLVNNDF